MQAVLREGEAMAKVDKLEDIGREVYVGQMKKLYRMFCGFHDALRGEV